MADAGRLGVDLSAAQVQQMATYAEMVSKWNRSMNLVSRRDMDRFYQRHLLDSLSGIPYITGERLLDVGSGAGLPGIPIAIACPDVAVALNERMAKRCRFLHQVVTRLELANVTIAEKGMSEVVGLFDTITARAVDSAEALWVKVNDKLAPDGRLLVYLSTSQSGEDCRACGLEYPVPQIPFATVMYQEVALPGLSGPHILCQIAAT